MKKNPGVFRFCYPKIDAFVSVLDREVAPFKDRPYFVGQGGIMFNTLTDLVFHGIQSNWTAVEAPNFGSKNEDGTYSGCMASVLNNESDAAVSLLDYPTEHFDKVIPYQIVMETQVKILSSYKPYNVRHAAYVDIGEASLKSFNLDVYFMAIIIMILGSLAFFFSRHVRGTYKQYSWHQSVFDSFSHLFLYEFEDFDHAFERINSLTLTFAGFMLVLYWSNLMSTDLIIIQNPETIDIYQQLLDKPGLSVHFLELETEHLQFRDAEEGCIEKKIWDEKRSKDLPTIITTTSGPDLVELLAKMFDKGLRSQVALLASDILMAGTGATVCAMKASVHSDEGIIKDAFPYISMDTNARKQLRTTIARRSSMNTPIMKNTVYHMKALTEMDLVHKIREVVAKGAKIALINPDPILESQCMWNMYHIPEADSDVTAVKVAHLTSTFLLLVCGLAVSFLSCLLETLCGRITQVKDAHIGDFIGHRIWGSSLRKQVTENKIH